MAAPLAQLEKAAAAAVTHVAPEAAAIEHMQQRALAARNAPLLAQRFTVSGFFAAAIGKTSSLVSTLAFGLPMIGGALGWLGDKKVASTLRVAAPLQKAGAIAGILNAPVSEAHTAVAEVFGTGQAEKATRYVMIGATNLQKTVSSYAGSVLEPARGAIHKSPHIHAIFTGAGNRVSSLANRVLGPSVGGQTSISNVLFSGTMVAGELASTMSNAQTRIATLRQMELDAGGSAPSWWGVRYGSSLHPLVKLARTEAKGWKARLATGLQWAGTLFNVVTMLRPGNTGLKGIAISGAVGMGTGAAANALQSSHTTLNSYRSMYMNIASQGYAAYADYVGVIGGLAKEVNYTMVDKFAKQCYDEKLSPPELLQRITQFKEAYAVKGKFTAAVQTRRGAIVPPANDEPGASVPQHTTPRTPEQPVLGSVTEQVVKKAREAAANTDHSTQQRAS